MYTHLCMYFFCQCRHHPSRVEIYRSSASMTDQDRLQFTQEITLFVATFATEVRVDIDVNVCTFMSRLIYVCTMIFLLLRYFSYDFVSYRYFSAISFISPPFFFPLPLSLS
jgi:hypothetical protein